jgi:hypothetical protein
VGRWIPEALAPLWAEQGVLQRFLQKRTICLLVGCGLRRAEAAALELPATS